MSPSSSASCATKPKSSDEATMTVLVIADHNHATLQAAVLNTIAAAQKIGGDLHVLVAGSNAQAAAQAAAQIPGVAKVLHADAPHLAGLTAENVAATIVPIVKSGGYSHVLAPATGLARTSCRVWPQCSTSDRSPKSSWSRARIRSCGRSTPGACSPPCARPTQSRSSPSVRRLRRCSRNRRAAAIETVAAGPDTECRRSPGRSCRSPSARS